MLKFLIIATGYNCSTYTKACYDSIINQTYQNFTFAMVDDGSTDGNQKVLHNLCKSIKCKIIEVPQNTGAAYGRWLAVNTIKPHDETVILLIGMDDTLLPNCLQRISEEYKKGVLMTYGNWKDQHGKMLPHDFPLHFPQHIHDARSYRTVTYRSTAPNTFKASLFKAIPKEDWKINGKWIDSTTESELMFSCLEMSGQKRIGIIYEPLCVYNRHPNSVSHRLTSKYKYKLLEVIKKRPKKELIKRK